MNASKHILDDFAESLAEVAVVEKAPKVEGRSISMVLAEKKSEYPLSPEHQHSCDSWFYIQGIGNIPVV